MRRALLPFLALLAVVTACSRDRNHVKVSFDSAAAATAAAEPLGPGDARVASTDGAVILSLVGDSVRMQLSDSLRRKVQTDLDTSNQGGIGGMITRSVSGIVGSALGFVVRVPVTDIDDIRYEDGRIRIEGKGGNGKFSMGRGRGGNTGDAAFPQGEGERFVAAVKARQAEVRQRERR